MQAVARLALFVMAAAHATPLPQGRHVTIQDGHAFSPAGEPSRDRTIVVTIGIVSIGLMCFLLGLRFSTLKRSIFMKRNVMSIMVLIIFFQILSFITLTTVLVSGQGLMTYELCKAATWVCLIGYTFTKFMIFLFLVERVHVVRAPFMNRRQDKIYLACMAMIFIAYGPLAISSYIDPLIAMDPESGRCRAGIRRSSTLPTIAVNSVVDMILTSVFLYLLRPVVKFRLPTTAAVLGTRRDSQHVRQVDTNETSTQKNIRTLLWKSIVGSLLIELPMIANMIQMAVTKGEELGMICLTICLIEAIWDALVIYWLAFGSSAQAEKDLQRSTTLSSKATLVQTPGGARSRRGSMEGGKNNFGFAVVDMETPEGGDGISLKQMPSRCSEGDTISLAPPRKCAERL